MKIVLSSDAQAYLARHPRRRLLTEKLEQLADDPASLANNIKRLTGRSDARLRVGDVRIIFEFNGDELIVKLIGPRGSAYE